jgi:hypothetical protein
VLKERQLLYFLLMRFQIYELSVYAMQCTATGYWLVQVQDWDGCNPPVRTELVIKGGDEAVPAW